MACYSNPIKSLIDIITLSLKNAPHDEQVALATNSSTASSPTWAEFQTIPPEPVGCSSHK